nr:cadmium resistance transporter [Paenibacillus sp. PL91]
MSKESLPCGSLTEDVSAAGTTLKVEAITFANGGDNFAIYIPIFASQTITGNIVTLLIFFILVAVKCFLGYKLVKNPLVAKVL